MGNNPRFCTKCGSEIELRAESVALKFDTENVGNLLNLGVVNLPKCINPACGEIYINSKSPQGQLLLSKISSVRANLGIPDEEEVKIVINKG